jgi:hypothetical protein
MAPVIDTRNRGDDGQRRRMTRLVGLTHMAQLGDRLPPGTRFCAGAEQVSIALTHGVLVAFVPCLRFERDGLYPLSIDGRFHVRRCALSNGHDSEIISTILEDTISIELVGKPLLGHVIGVVLLQP